MEKEKIVLFGAGKIGMFCAKMFRYDKNIVCFVDNDGNKTGSSVEGIRVRTPESLHDLEFDRVIISTCNYAAIVVQLEELGVHNYVYYDDVYSWQLKCKSREILDCHIPEHSEGQYKGRFVKNAWMNHLTITIWNHVMPHIFLEAAKSWILAAVAGRRSFIGFCKSMTLLALIVANGSWISALRKFKIFISRMNGRNTFVSGMVNHCLLRIARSIW